MMTRPSIIPSVQALRKNNVAAKPSDLCVCAQWRAVRADNVLKDKVWNEMEWKQMNWID
jgi:hypothetical protein